MSVLLVGIRGREGEAIVGRLIAQGDEVRVIEGDPQTSERWRSLGAHVARPDYDMADLVERAAQNVRTVVIGDAAADNRDLVDSIVAGAGSANVERIVLYAPRPDLQAVHAVKASQIQYIVLATGRGRRGLGAEELADAVDAADDIGGERRLELDLTDPEAWANLGLRLDGGA